MSSTDKRHTIQS